MRDTISTAWHAFFDYVIAFTLLLCPWLFSFDTSDIARSVSTWLGICLLLQALVTRYEGGLVRVLPMRIHLNLDVVVGIFLIASPFLFDFSYGGYVFYILIGVLVLWAGLYTKYHPHKTDPPVEIKYETERQN